MKKTILSGVFAALATVILCVCLTACSANVAGTYKFYSMKGKMEGISVDMKVGDKFMDVLDVTEDFIVLTLNEDGTATMTSQMTGSLVPVKGTWKKDGSKYILSLGGDDQEFKVSGKTLTIKDANSEIKLKK